MQTTTSILLIFFTLFSFQLNLTSQKPIPPEANYNFTEYVTTYNYPVHTHYITAEDGYVLTFFRLQAKYTQIQSNLPVILLQHGLLDSSDSFITNFEEQAPAFLLANAGYDVWLGNNRGNKYSQGHVNPDFDSDNKAGTFWDFSWQEMAWYDTPASFNYIGNLTGQKVNYMGHSQGATVMFAALARRDSAVLANLGKFIALAPAVYVEHSSSPLVQVGGWLRLGNLPKDLLIFLDKKTFGYMSPRNRYNHEWMCSNMLWLCVKRVKMLTDHNTKVDNVERLAVTSGHFTAGSSVQNMAYWQQMFKAKEFKMYDFGANENLKRYGQKNAPGYPLAVIREPIYIFAGKYDELAGLKDTEKLRSQLIGSKEVVYKTYELGHTSFMLGKNVKDYIHDALDILKSQKSSFEILNNL